MNSVPPAPGLRSRAGYMRPIVEYLAATGCMRIAWRGNYFSAVVPRALDRQKITHIKLRAVPGLAFASSIECKCCTPPRDGDGACRDEPCIIETPSAGDCSSPGNVRRGGSTLAEPLERGVGIPSGERDLPLYGGFRAASEGQIPACMRLNFAEYPLALPPGTVKVEVFSSDALA